MRTRVTVIKLANPGRVSILIQPIGWSRWFRREVHRYARRTGLGWAWEDSWVLIDDEPVEKALADALLDNREF